VTLDPATGTISNILNLASGVSADVSMDIGFYNSSIGGCTAGVNSWAKQRAQRKVPGGSRDRREAFETGMVCLFCCFVLIFLQNLIHSNSF
jgi:hypothetical protein